MVKVVLLAALVRLLIATDSPFTCSGIYTFFCLVIGLLAIAGGQASLLAVVVTTAICFGLSSLYFWLLYRLQEGLMWWIVFLCGLTIGFL